MRISKSAPSPEEIARRRAAVPSEFEALFLAIKAEVDENQDEANENQEYLIKIAHWLLAVGIGVGFLVALALVKLYLFGVMASWG